MVLTVYEQRQSCDLWLRRISNLYLPCESSRDSFEFIHGLYFNRWEGVPDLELSEVQKDEIRCAYTCLLGFVQEFWHDILIYNRRLPSRFRAGY